VYQNGVQNNSGFDGRAKNCRRTPALAGSAGLARDIRILLHLIQGMNPVLTKQNDVLYNK
jgi:hypothetical protein